MTTITVQSNLASIETVQTITKRAENAGKILDFSTLVGDLGSKPTAKASKPKDTPDTNKASDSPTLVANLLKAILAAIKNSEARSDSQAASSRDIQNLLKAILPFLNQSNGKNGDAGGPKDSDVQDLLKAMIPFVQKGISAEKAGNAGANNGGAEEVKNLLKAVLALVENSGSAKGDEAKAVVDLLKAILPFANGGSERAAGSASGNVTEGLGKVLSGLGDILQNKDAANKVAAGGQFPLAPPPPELDTLGLSLLENMLAAGGNRVGDLSGSDDGGNLGSVLQTGSGIAPVGDLSGTGDTENIESALQLLSLLMPLMLKLVDAKQSPGGGVGGDRSFEGEALRDVLSSNNGNEIKLNGQFAGGTGPGGEFASQDGPITIANKDGSLLGNKVEVDLKKLFSKASGADNIDEMATFKIKYANGQEEMVSASGAQSDKNGSQTVTLGNGRDQIQSIEMAMPRGTKEGSSTRDKSDAGVSAVRTFGAPAGGQTADLREIRDLIQAILNLTNGSRLAGEESVSFSFSQKISA